MSNVRYVGLDVHKDSIVMSVAESGTAEAGRQRLYRGRAIVGAAEGRAASQDGSPEFAEAASLSAIGKSLVPRP